MSDTIAPNNNTPSKIPQGKIPTPWAQQWKRIRYQLMPVLIAGAIFLGTGWLWNRHYAPHEATGVVRVVEVDATSPVSGVLAEPLGKVILKINNPVSKNEVIARLEDAPLLAEISVRQSNLDRLMKEVPAKAEEIRLDLESRHIQGVDDYRKQEVEVQQKTLSILHLSASIQTENIDLEKKKALLEMMKNGNSRDFDLVQMEKDIESKSSLIKSQEKELQAEEKFLESAISNLQQFPDGAAKADFETLIQPIKASIETEKAKLNELKLQFKMLDIISPIDGYIVEIHRYPKQGVRAGDPVATIINNRGQQIVTYVRAEQHLNLALIEKVEIRPDAGSTQVYTSAIESFGPAYKQVPSTHLRDQKIVEWGIPVMIGIPNNVALTPGQTVNLRFIERANKGS